MPTFGYGRVSTYEQTSENQRLELETGGFKVDYWFADTASGKTAAAERPEFSRVLDRIRTGETLIVSKLDRLGRNAADVLATLKRLEEAGIKVVCAQLGSLDLTSLAGKVVTGVLAAIAELERGLIVERTKAGLARAKAAGKRFGRPAKLTGEQRVEVKRRLLCGDRPTDIARDYKVSRALIYQVGEEQPN